MNNAFINKIIGLLLILVAIYSYFYEAGRNRISTALLMILFGIYVIVLPSSDNSGAQKFAKILGNVVIVISVLLIAKVFFFG